MPAFTPVNALEVALRKLIASRDEPVWNFFTPLAAARLWLIVKHHPELDGSDLVAPEGCNPDIAVFQGPEGSVVSVYTAEERARAACEFFGLSPANFTWISAQGYPLLKWLWADHGIAEDAHFFVNFGAENAAYHLDADLIEILLAHPAPPSLSCQPDELVNLHPAGNPEATLGPLREFLARSPNVRAAWIVGVPPASPNARSPAKYELALVMVDPEDQSLLEPVGVILKAVTPLETEWSVAVLMAPEESYRKMAVGHPPFYARPEFRASCSGSGNSGG